MNLARRILALAWPVLIGQWAVMLSGTIDTMVTGHASALDLAAMAVGSAIYGSVYIGLMGIVMALNPFVASRVGAGDPAAAGRSLIDGLWLALLLSVVGGVAIGYPGLWLRLTQVPPEVAARVTGYLNGLVFALPGALLFRAVYAFNTAIARPKLVMTINLIGLALKLPLDIALVYGHLGLPKMGAPGCAIATGLVMWTSCLIACWRLRKDAHYRIYALRFAWPHLGRLQQLLAIGIPTGLSYIVEVTSFTSMALIAARLGVETTGGHQIAANLAALCYMVPLGLSVATATLVAQALGGGHAALAERTLSMGLRLAGCAALLLASTLFLSRHVLVALYTSDQAAAAIAVPLIGLVAIFHLCDALQSVASFTLRAYGRTVAPMLIYTVALWGGGLAGGYYLAFHATPWSPPMGVKGLWLAATLALGAAAGVVVWYAKRIARHMRSHPELIKALGAEPLTA